MNYIGIFILLLGIIGTVYFIKKGLVKYRTYSIVAIFTGLAILAQLSGLGTSIFVIAFYSAVYFAIKKNSKRRNYSLFATLIGFLIMVSGPVTTSSESINSYRSEIVEESSSTDDSSAIANSIAKAEAAAIAESEAIANAEAEAAAIAESEAIASAEAEAAAIAESEAIASAEAEAAAIAEAIANEEKMASVTAAVKNVISQNQGWALGTLDRDGNPTETGTPNLFVFGWSLFILDVKVENENKATLLVSSEFLNLDENERTNVLDSLQSNIQNELYGEPTPNGVYLTVYSGNNIIASSKITNDREYKWKD